MMVVITIPYTPGVSSIHHFVAGFGIPLMSLLHSSFTFAIFAVIHRIPSLGTSFPFSALQRIFLITFQNHPTGVLTRPPVFILPVMVFLLTYIV